MKVIHVLSGGLDSTTLLYWLLDKGHEVECISFDYGQRHKKELECAKITCKKLKVKHTVVDITSITKLISNSALTGKTAVPKGHYADKTMKATVVPSRNTIMASIAQGYAVNKNFDAICLGVHSGDHAIYPDCRPVFVEALRKLFSVNNYKPIKVLTPFIKISKIDIVTKGLVLGVDYSLAWTCYVGGTKPCQKCGACVERAEAFDKNNFSDPLI
jgi:7-cyano-7-deazaguanine synthase